MKAYIFPGQGAQFSGMGKDVFETGAKAKELFRAADDLLGFSLSKIMFEGTEEELRETKVTQPAIFLHSVVRYLTVSPQDAGLVAGHSLGEFSALVANGTLQFEDGLKLVSQRANAMQKACELKPGTMAAVLGLADEVVEEVCSSIKEEIVVAANYNCPGQLVISGTVEGIHMAAEKLKTVGAKRVLVLQVGGAFHSPLMAPARDDLKKAIENTQFNVPKCPVIQNVNAAASTDTQVIRQSLIDQLTGPVRWTQSVQAMVNAGATEFLECGPGKVLQGLVKKISPDKESYSV
jgi:[acyl-carrier-protein] S-malonyltransferase